jgi:hypothetical protein
VETCAYKAAILSHAGSSGSYEQDQNLVAEGILALVWRRDCTHGLHGLHATPSPHGNGEGTRATLARQQITNGVANVDDLGSWE